MRHIKDVLRLRHEHRLSLRSIADSLNLSRNTVRDYLHRFERAGVPWPLPPDITDDDLAGRLFPPRAPLIATVSRPIPDWAAVHRELREHRNVNLTLTQLWIEYKEAHPVDGYQYTQFCELYHRWLDARDLVMRQSHRGGEKIFLDYTDGLALVDPLTGEFHFTQLFLAVWGASSFTYAEASLTQTLPHWIGAHARAFAYFNAVPRLRQPAALEDLDTRHHRGLPKQTLQELSRPDWIARGRNVLLTGPTGIGKFWIACALGNFAARQGFSVAYLRAPRLFELLHQARADGSHLKLLGKLAKAQLLILDDFLIAPLAEPERRDLLEIVEDRHGLVDTVVTSQLPTAHWHEALGEPTLADALLDRLLQGAFKLSSAASRSAAPPRRRPPHEPLGRFNFIAKGGKLHPLTRNCQLGAWTETEKPGLFTNKKVQAVAGTTDKLFCEEKRAGFYIESRDPTGDFGLNHPAPPRPTPQGGGGSVCSETVGHFRPKWWVNFAGLRI